MAEVGKVNALTVLRPTEYGLIMDGGPLGEILLPNRYAPNDWRAGELLEVFIMLDSEDRLLATTERPYAMVDEFACLKVVAVTEIGAFLDWGLPKDLLVPFRQQNVEMREGQSYMVRVYFDEVSERMAASAKLDRFLDRTPPPYKVEDKVQLQIAAKTDMGYKAIINGEHWGMIFNNQVFQPLHKGQCIEGYIQNVRDDLKIDLSLQKPGSAGPSDVSAKIVEYMKSLDGFMPITDKSNPEEIYRIFGVSKKAYKRAIGGLYKKRLITFENNGTKLI